SPEMVWEAITDPDRAMEFAVGSLLGGAARGAVEAGSLIQPAAPSPAAPQPATQSGPTAQPAAGGVGENVSGAGQDTRPETTPVAPGESAARTSPAQQARQEVAIDDLSSLNYRQLVDRAKALGMKPPWGKIAELREAVRQAQADASNRQQTDISAGQSDPSSQPSASRTGERQGAASINEQLESYLAS